MSFDGWLLLLLPLIFIPRLFQLDVFLTPDEPLFLQHAREFAVGLSGGDFSQTLGIGYPGVTVAWGSFPFMGAAPADLSTYAAGRLAIAVLSGGLLWLLYSLAKSLLGRAVAFLGVGLLALDPYTLSYSRLLHIAAPLALFMTLAGVTFLLWLRDHRFRWLGLTGLFTGLALLTKSTALLLGPMLFFIIVGWLLTTGRWRETRVWLTTISGLIIVGLLAAFTFYLFWPAMWTHPQAALDLTFGKLFTDQAAGTGNLGLFWFGHFVEDPGPAFYPVAFLLKATPWLLIGLILSFWSMIRPSSPPLNKKLLTTDYQLPITAHCLPLWLFALTYLILMTIASKKSIRYMLPAFPVFYLLAGMALYQGWTYWRAVGLEDWKIFSWLGVTQLTKKCHSERRMSEESLRIMFSNDLCRDFSSFLLKMTRQLRKSYWFQSSLIFLLLSLFSFLYHPYYFTYYNPLILGWRWAPATLLVGWGEGLDQAADYLNEQPATNTAAWYEWLFPLYYQGQTHSVVPQENMITSDHTVLYLNQVQRDIPSPNIIHYFRTRRQPEHTVRLNGIDYAWVYPGPIAGSGQNEPSLQHPQGGIFGEELRLLGYDLHPQARSGDPLIVTLHWRVMTPPQGERFVYVRLVDKKGRIWAKADSPPVMGLWPVDRWQPEMLIEDAHELLIPAGTPPGSYRLEVGVYDPNNGQTLPASGQPLGQGGGLLLGEVAVAWQPLAIAPELPRTLDVRMAPNAKLLGHTLPPTTATTGDLIPLEFAWQEAGGLLASRLVKPFNDYVMFEWRDSQGKFLAEQLDPLPMPIPEWGRGATMRSQHAVIVPPTLSNGDYTLWVLLHDSSAPAGESVIVGQMAVTAPAHAFALPDSATPLAPAPTLDQVIGLQGYKIHLTETEVAVNLYWQTDRPLNTRYKIFAQLLTADNSLIAQSDTIPASGQRPTTGWLPAEIITDPHTLSLPADTAPGTYRLITGLYDPRTNTRLPLLNESGETIADFIPITEVSLP